MCGEARDLPENVLPSSTFNLESEIPNPLPTIPIVRRALSSSYVLGDITAPALHHQTACAVPHRRRRGRPVTLVVGE